MTCIVGVVSGEKVWLGGDSAATDGALNRTLIKDSKVFNKGELVFGVCGLPKVMDALRFGMELPVQSGGSAREFLVKALVPAIRSGLKELDCVGEDDGQLCFDGAMLMGYRGELFVLQGNFQLVKSADDFASVGSGSSHALGSLHSTTNEPDPRKRLMAALEASTRNAGCAPPFTFVSTKDR